MGEAKRKKQLGLMPTVIPFEATVLGREITLSDEIGKWSRPLRQKLETTLFTGAGWESEYRTGLVFAGGVHYRLETAADVRRLPVPAYRRVWGEVVVGKKFSETTPRIGELFLPLDGGVVRIRGQAHSFDGKKWEQFPKPKIERIQAALNAHPAFFLTGESLGEYRVEQWQEGRIDVHPEPPTGVLETLEEMAREWHGTSAPQWQLTHENLLGLDKAATTTTTEALTKQIPVAKRTFFQLKTPAPLQNPLHNIFGVRGDVEILPTDESFYSFDGIDWWSYQNPEAAPEQDDFMELFSQMLNVESVPVTVYSDGNIEWEEGDIPEEYAEKVKADLIQSTGAGTERWKDWSRQVLADTFFAADPDTAKTAHEWPIPHGIRLDIAKDAIADPDPLSQTYIESEVTFDNKEWLDLYNEEIPHELLLAIANLTK